MRDREIDFLTPLMDLPMHRALAMVNSMLNRLTLRDIAEVCVEHGFKPEIILEERDAAEDGGGEQADQPEQHAADGHAGGEAVPPVVEPEWHPVTA
jgi:hypothetical protein